MKVTLIEHYDKLNSCEDYWDIEILLDGKKVAHYGSYYDDKGDSKVEGFLDALIYLKLVESGDINVEQVRDR